MLCRLWRVCWRVIRGCGRPRKRRCVRRGSCIRFCRCRVWCGVVSWCVFVSSVGLADVAISVGLVGCVAMHIILFDVTMTSSSTDFCRRGSTTCEIFNGDCTVSEVLNSTFSYSVKIATQGTVNQILFTVLITPSVGSLPSQTTCNARGGQLTALGCGKSV